jgi:hypothetical protein
MRDVAKLRAPQHQDVAKLHAPPNQHCIHGCIKTALRRTRGKRVIECAALVTCMLYLTLPVTHTDTHTCPVLPLTTPGVGYLRERAREMGYRVTSWGSLSLSQQMGGDRGREGYRR